MARGQFSGEKFSSGTISRGGGGAILRGAIFLGDNYPRGQLSEGQFSSGAIALEPFNICVCYQCLKRCSVILLSL